MGTTWGTASRRCVAAYDAIIPHVRGGNNVKVLETMAAGSSGYSICLTKSYGSFHLNILLCTLADGRNIIIYIYNSNTKPIV